MLEFIGFIALCFIGYKVIVFFLKSKKSLDNSKNAFEIRNFATNELQVPSNYFNYITSSKIEEIKKKALYLKENNFKDSSWQCLMATSIYLYFYEDCKKTEYGINPIIDFLKIDENVIKNQLESNPYEIINYFINAKKDYQFWTNDQITNLIIKSSKIKNNNISHNPSIYERIERYANENYYSYGYNDGNIYFYTDEIDEITYGVVVEPINPDEDEKSPMKLHVDIPKFQ
jgi:hypothetical protein